MFRRKKKCIRVQMYLAGRSEQEIDATQFDEDGEPIPPLHGGHHGGSGHHHHQHHHHGSVATTPSAAATSSISTSGSTSGSDGEAGSPGGSIESSETNSIRSPATPGGGLSIASLGSPASIASPATPGGSSSADLFALTRHQK